MPARCRSETIASAGYAVVCGFLLVRVIGFAPCIEVESIEILGHGATRFFEKDRVLAGAGEISLSRKSSIFRYKSHQSKLLL